MSTTCDGPPRPSIAVDIGGTFTDVVLRRPADEVTRAKVLTDARQPAEGVMRGVRKALAESGIALADCDVFLHATTLATNAIIERSGPRIGLITNRNFRDTLEMAHEDRYDIYQLNLSVAPPLIPRELRLGVRGRIDVHGTAVEDVDDTDIEQRLAQLVEAGCRGVGVCLLHSYVNPAHEQRVREIAAGHYPDLDVTLSSDVLPEIREYERTVVVVVNAYLRPIVRSYLEALVGALRAEGYQQDVFVMSSAGGVVPVEEAERFPVRLVESGPAAGAVFAACFAASVGIYAGTVLSLDMGGTTAKASVIRGGTPIVEPELEVARQERFKPGSGIPIKLPSVDLIEIGAGGGSIAWLDSLGLLRVGPRSAGSQPGPACYGLEGTLPTVTDADLILGHLSPDYFLGGNMRLDVKAAEQSIREWICRPLDLSVPEAAAAIRSVVDEHMAAAARLHAVERGLDPAVMTLVAFGGAGPVHACEVATRLGIDTVVCPLGAGVASALGLMASRQIGEVSRSWIQRLDRLDWTGLNALLEGMRGAALARLTASGVYSRDVVVERVVDARYVGQGYEVTVDLPPDRLTPTSGEALLAGFRECYERRFGRQVGLAIPIEGVTWRVRVARSPLASLPRVSPRAFGEDGQGALKGMRACLFDARHGYVETPVYDHYRTRPGDRLTGPAIVEEEECTVVVPPDFTASVLGDLSLVMRRRG
ncbi:MAG: hydantoinase/oxoprolinase family protein [Candidatus Rokubacteria bacterium]|nr:hydantoinase/oxoprolinase family protein [Candidatus Rokubacteria bacterium]